MSQTSMTQLRTLLDNEVQASDAAIKTLKLPLSNYIHTLYLKLAVTNGATDAENQSAYDAFDKIEVIANGSDVLYSLTPREAKAWYLWEKGMNIPQVRNESASAVQSVTIPIFFGRSEYDPNYYLACARFTDLELKITYSPTIAATAFATGTTTITVHALMTMGTPPDVYGGTLVHKTIKAFTSAASGDDQTLLPRGNNLRQLLVYAYEAAIEDGVDITRVKFDLNNQERVLVDAKFSDIQGVNKIDRWVKHEEEILCARDTTEVENTFVSRIASVNLQTTTAADIIQATVIAGDAVTVTGTITTPFHMAVVGYGVSHAAVLDFAKQGEQNLLNTAEFDQLQLTLTQGGAGADVRVSTQEVRSL
jgi:phosphotransferase system IIB component